MSEWTVRKLGEVCATIQDGAHESPSEQFSEPAAGRFLYITSKNIRTNYLDLSDVSYVDREFHDRIYPRCSPKLGDVLLTKDGANTGNVTLNTLDAPFSLLSSVCLLKTHPDALTSAFLCYYLQSPAGLKSITGQMTGAAIKRIILRDIKLATIPLPPVPEQRRIVGILDEAFEGIATAKANAEKNLQNARALFESHLEAVFSRGKEWPFLPIGEVATIFDGPHATPKTVDSGPIFLGISALQDGSINLGETRHVTAHDFTRWTRRVKPQADDIVFSYETRLGQAAIIPSDLDCCLGRRMGLVRTDPKRLSPRFFMYQYLSPPFRDFLRSQTVRGATVDRIPLKEFPRFPIALPGLKEQEQIIELCGALRLETQRLESIYEQKLSALEAVKKSLLHQAFTGKL